MVIYATTMHVKSGKFEPCSGWCYDLKIYMCLGDGKIMNWRGDCGQACSNLVSLLNAFNLYIHLALSLMD